MSTCNGCIKHVSPFMTNGTWWSYWWCHHLLDQSTNKNIFSEMSAKQDRLRNLYISLKLTFTLTITLISLIYRGMYDFELNEWCVTHVKKWPFISIHPLLCRASYFVSMTGWGSKFGASLMRYDFIVPLSLGFQSSCSATLWKSCLQVFFIYIKKGQVVYKT